MAEQVQVLRRAIFATPAWVRPTAVATARRDAPSLTARTMASSRRARAARAASEALRAVWMGSANLLGFPRLAVAVSVPLGRVTDLLRVPLVVGDPLKAGDQSLYGGHGFTVNRVATVCQLSIH